MVDGKRVSVMSIRCWLEWHTPDYPIEEVPYYRIQLRGKGVKCIRCGREGYYNGYDSQLIWKRVG